MRTRFPAVRRESVSSVSSSAAGHWRGGPRRARLPLTPAPNLCRNGRGGGTSELPDLDVHPAVELLALLGRLVAEGTLLADGDDLDRRLRDAELDQELPDRVGTPLRQ